MRPLALVVFLLATSRAIPDSPETAQVGQYEQPKKLALIADEAIDESSGLARCLLQPDAFWTHNDSGDRPRLFLFNKMGETLASFDVIGAKAVDWEDMCSFQYDERNYLLIGDVGDNGAQRKSAKLYLIEEPPIDTSESKRARKVRVHAIMQFKYKDGPHNCEAIGVDVKRSKILLVSKHLSLQTTVYELPLFHETIKTVFVAQPIATLSIPGVTAMDVSPDGTRAVVLTYLDAIHYERKEDETWSMAFRHTPELVVMPKRRQGEAICFGDDGRSLYLTSERTAQPFWEVPFVRRTAGKGCF